MYRHYIVLTLIYRLGYRNAYNILIDCPHFNTHTHAFIERGRGSEKGKNNERERVKTERKGQHKNT